MNSQLLCPIENILTSTQKQLFNTTFNLNFSDLKPHLKKVLNDNVEFLERKFDSKVRYVHSNGSYYYFDLSEDKWYNGEN
jgi:outer membrane protein OmpA-like peptidoglycan-associated protein